MATTKRQTEPNTEPQAVDLDHLEENIKGAFVNFLARGQVDVNSLDALAKVRHNTFDSGMIEVYNQLFRPDKPQPDNKKRLLPYDDLTVIETIVNVYISLCALCDVDSTIHGFSLLTGINENVLKRWQDDELNPARSGFIKRIVQNRIAGIESKLSDHPIGTTALANNSTSLGMLWARNNAQLQSQKAVYIIPADSTRGLPSVPAAGENLPPIIEDGTI